MDGANGKTKFAKVLVPERPYQILEFIITMVSYAA
jgi:hypothetical protein